jgi:hypothetical protein
MISMNATTLPPLPTPRDLEAVLSLVTLLADPKAAQSRIVEFRDAAEKSRQVIEQCQKDTASLAALRQTTERDLADARAKHAAQLAQEREAHNEACQRRSDELDAREKRTAELKAQAEADAAEAARLKADMQRRIRIISGEAA